MAYIVRMPKLGLEMKEGILLEWHVSEGDAVDAGAVLAEIESEKTQAEVEAREAGVLRRVYLEEGQACEPGTPIGILAGADEDIAELETQVEDEHEGDIEPPEPRPEGEEPTTRETGQEEPADSGRAVKASPPARKRAEELGVDLASVDGTGPDGVILPEDVERAGGAEPEAGGPEPSGLTLREERPLRGTRATIAERLTESYRNAVHVTERRTVDAEAIVSVADAAAETYDADVAVTDVILLALSRTLAAHPGFNAQFEDDVHRLYEEHNVCVAVDTDRGLIAPVIRNIDGKSIEELATERHRVTELVLEGEHTAADLSGGTFTITNLGPFGVESFSPIINPPQVAILGINAIAKQAVPASDDTIEVRRRLPLNLSFDHRVVDGADAARFLATLSDHLDEPWSLVPAELSTNR